MNKTIARTVLLLTVLAVPAAALTRILIGGSAFEKQPLGCPPR